MSEEIQEQTSSESAEHSESVGSGEAGRDASPEQLISDLKNTVEDQKKQIQQLMTHKQWAEFGRAVAADPELKQRVKEKWEKKKEEKKEQGAGALTAEEVRKIIREESESVREAQSLRAWAEKELPGFDENDPMLNVAFETIGSLVDRGEIEVPAGMGKNRFILREAHRTVTSFKGGQTQKKADEKPSGSKSTATAAGSSGARSGATDEKRDGKFTQAEQDRLNSILAYHRIDRNKL